MFRRSSSSAKLSNPIDSRDRSGSPPISSTTSSSILQVANPDETSIPAPSPQGARPTRSMSRSSSLSNIFKRKDKEGSKDTSGKEPRQHGIGHKHDQSKRRTSTSVAYDNANGAVEEKVYHNGVEILGSSARDGEQGSKTPVVGSDATAGIGAGPNGTDGPNQGVEQRPLAVGDGHGGEDLVINNGNGVEEGTGGQGDRKRKMSVGHKARNRLSSLFNKDKDRTSSRSDRSRSASIISNTGTDGLPGAVPPMPVNHAYPGSGLEGELGTNGSGSITGMPSPSLSTKIRKPPPAPSTGSGISTPTKGLSGGGGGAGGGGMGSPLGGSGSSLGGLSGQGRDGLAVLGLGKPILGNGIASEPETLDTNSGSSGTPSSPTPRSTSNGATTGTATNRERSASLYSQWSYDFEQDEDDSDGEVFMTPPEGLSEVEEEDEEEEERRERHILAVHGLGGDGVSGKQGSEGKKGGEEKGMSSTDSGVVVGEKFDQVDPPDYNAASGSTTLPPLMRKESTPIIHRAAVVASAGVSAHHRSLAARAESLPPLDQAPILQADIKECQNILELFLTSRMKQAESIVYDHDPTGQHMYIQNAGAVIQCIKGMMTFDVEDLKEALEIAKGTSALAASIRKPQGSVVGRFAGLVRGGTGTGHIRSMDLTQKHAELIYAESLLIKAVLGIVAGGDWVGLIKEALNMRAAHGIYRTLQAYQDEVAIDGSDSELDEHFKSGVELGTGLSSLMLSLLPGKVLKLAEMFGYAGDRKLALSTLMAAGGWRSDQDEPTFNADHDGIRRPICDMALLTFHLVISVLMPVSGVDIPMAKKILDYNMKRFPDGVFFMYFQSRLYTTQAQPELAQKQLQEALDLKLEYLQLQHICLWDMGVNSLMLGQFKRADECFRILATESSWSKAVYMYSQAACLAELAETTGENLDDVRLRQMMTDVPKSMKKIAGKSLPVEKFVSRKARKFTGQNNRLLLPATELGYFFGALPNTPPRILYSVTIPRVKRQLDLIQSASPDTYQHGPDAYYDDLALALFLDGVSHSFAGYPHVEAIIRKEDVASYPMSAAEAGRRSEQSLLAVLEHGPQVKLDHQLIYHAHFELARLYSHLGNNQEAKRHLELVLSGRPLEVAPAAKNQGKYSMESALMLKAHAGLSSLKEDDQAKMH